MSNSPRISDSNQEINETLYLDFEEYKQKYLENKKLRIENYLNDNKISDKEKIINFLESEFYFLEEQQKAIFYSNEEMNKYCTIDDEDINECKAENMKIIFKNFERMKIIQDDIIALDRNHYFKDRNYLSILDKSTKEEDLDYKDPNKNPLIVEFIDRSNENKSGNDNITFEKNFEDFFIHNTNNEINNVSAYDEKLENEEEIIRELEL